jgi:cell division protein FtsL
MTTTIWARDNRYIKTAKRHWQISWIFVFVLFVILISFVYVSLNAKSNQIGFQISEELQLQEKLKEANYNLKLEWAYLTSPQNLSIEAKARGFTHPEKTIKIDEELTL